MVGFLSDVLADARTEMEEAFARRQNAIEAAVVCARDFSSWRFLRHVFGAWYRASYRERVTNLFLRNIFRSWYLECVTCSSLEVRRALSPERSSDFPWHNELFESWADEIGPTKAFALLKEHLTD